MMAAVRGGSNGRFNQAFMPTHLQQQLAVSSPGSPEDRQMLADLEDAVMRIPSEELLQAAFVRFGDIVSIQLPKDPASRTLCFAWEAG